MSANRRVLHMATVDLSLRHLLLNQMVALQKSGYEVHAVSAPGRATQAVADAGIVVHDATSAFLPVAASVRLTYDFSAIEGTHPSAVADLIKLLPEPVSTPRAAVTVPSNS